MIIDKRQDVIFADDGERRVYVCDKSCQNAQIAKWSVFLGLFFLIFLWLIVGYFHARRRIRNGMKPLFYHRFLAPKEYRMQNNPAYYGQQPPQGFYGMQNYPEPPPMYNPNGMPPAYMPPPGATKATPHRDRGSPPPAPAPIPGQAPPQIPPITQ